MFQRFDFATFQGADGPERELFCQNLVANLQQHGFVKIINHGIPAAVIDDAFETCRQFFDLPLGEKLKSPHPPTPNPHRGYSAFGIENVSAHSNFDSLAPMPALKDMKESYDIGSERDELYDNIWPPPGVHNAFKPTFTKYFEACYQAELTILEAISLGLGLPGDTLGQFHVNQSNELRLTHYPAVSRGDFAHSTRIAAHTDFGTITILFHDGVGGLQVESPRGSGNFVDIEIGEPHECILNVGDCLQRWAGLNSARHRVHLPKQAKAPANGTSTDDIVTERFSIAYFAKPDRTASLRPVVDALVPKDTEKFLTAGEFQLMRISGTY